MIVTVTLNPAIDQTVQVDQLHKGAVNKVTDCIETPGGKGINVARVLADLEWPVAATGLMGDKSQAFFHDYLTDHSISDEFVSVDGVVRSNIKLVSQADSVVTDINFPGFDGSEASINQVLGVIKTFPENTLIAVCGSVPRGISLECFEHFLRLIKSSGYRLAVDTSGEALARAVTVKPDLIKPNIDELSELAGKALTKDEAMSVACGLVEQGIKMVVLSCGEAGASFITEETNLFARPGHTPVVSTVGAGDSMMAGCLYSIEQGFTPEHMARLATACGMKAVSQPGVGDCSVMQLEELMASVEVSKTEKHRLLGAQQSTRQGLQ